MKGENIDPAVLGSVSREIWFRGGSRDATQTAIARLYSALGSLKADKISGYRREVAMALAVGASDSDGRPNPDKLSHLIESFLVAIK